MTEAVLKPLNLNNTYMFEEQVNNDQMTCGYKIEFFKSKLYNAPIYRGNKPAGYIISNCEDMAKWLKIQMNTSDELEFDEDLVAKSHEPNKEVNSAKDEFYSAGWFNYPNGRISHGGNNPNYSSYITFSTEDKIGIAILGNSNSDYVEQIAFGINQILHSHPISNNINDFNKSTDKIAVIIICILSVLVLTTLIFFIKALIEVFRKDRLFKSNGIRSGLKLIISLLFMLGVSYCIYLLPQVLYSGVSWQFAFIWLPGTIKIAMYLLYIFVWIVYMYFVFTSFFKKLNDKGLVLLSILSILSGFGNALIIFTINTSISSSNTVRIRLFAYFILGIILYVYGQKLMREKLIEFANDIVYSKRMTIVKKLLRCKYSKFQEIEKGRIESTLNNDTESISRFVNILIGGLTSAITLICCFIYLGTISIYALLLSILIILFIASIYYLVGRYANRLGEEARDIQNVFFQFINDLIGGIKELSLNENRKSEFEKDMDRSCKNYKVKRSKAALAFANMFVIGELLFTLAIGSIVFVFPFILKNLDSTSLTSYVFVLLYMTGPIHAILDTIPNAIEIKISLKRIDSLIEEITISNNQEIESSNKYVDGNLILKLKDVEYEYNNKEGEAFKVGPINYEFRSGEITFITGGNGSGKSTLARLLTGLYLPTKGQVTLNANEDHKLINESCSTVFADFYLFDKLYGINYKGKEDEIQKYLKILQLDGKVQIQDGKFSTIKLSTGQKKRLALLVAYLEDRPIYLFDEWAADQDPEFRLFFYNTLLPELKAKGKCIIAVTHDDKYFNLGDKIIRMELGKISDSSYEKENLL